QIWNEGNQSYSPLTSSPASSIPATNGFMVQVQTAPGSLTLPAAKRAHSADPFYKSSNAFVKLVAHNVAVGNAQESFVYFNPDATTGFDQMYDGDFLEGYAPRFYSVSGEEHFSVNSLPQLVSNLQIPFDFIKNEGTSFSIQAAQIENIETQVYLTDLKLNQTQELTTNPVYNFTSTDGDNPARFVLSFGLMTGTGDKTDSNKGIYTFENNLYLVNPGKAKFEVYNLTGQKLQAQEIDSPGLFKTTLYLPTAYYVVRMTTGTKVVVKKVFIKS
ncbi:MAG: T9SS type A sorting domain-containing protein, partial [bacterium]